MSDFDENITVYRINNADSEYISKSLENIVNFVEHGSRILFNWENIVFSIQ